MRKTIVSLFSILILLIVCGCGENKQDILAEKSTSFKEQVKEASKKEEENRLVSSDAVNLPGIRYYYSKYRGRANGGGVSAYYDADNTVIAVLFGEEFEGTLDDVLPALDDGFYVNVFTGLSDADFYEAFKYNYLELETSEKVTVGTLETLRFTATLRDDHDDPYEVFGYAFIVEGKPYAFYAFDADKERAAERKEELHKEVEDMMLTIQVKS